MIDKCGVVLCEVVDRNMTGRGRGRGREGERKGEGGRRDETVRGR